jgi:hypothetical protein
MRAVFFSADIRVVLSLSRLAIIFCVLDYFRGVGAEVRWVASLCLPTHPVFAFAWLVIPYADLRRKACRPGRL